MRKTKIEKQFDKVYKSVKYFIKNISLIQFKKILQNDEKKRANVARESKKL